MAKIEMPGELGKAYWDKKKGAVPAGSALEGQLKTFEKKYAAVDWSPFADGWEAKARTAQELDELHAAVDRAWRAKVFALKAEGQAVAEAAQKLLKEKGLAKVTLDAVKSIADAAKAFGKDIDEGLEQIGKAHAKAAKALPEGDEEDEAPNALLDPKRLLKQLQQCKRDPARRANFAFLNDNKAPPVLALAPKTSPRKLFATLQGATGVKTGAFGRAWIDANVLYLEVDKAYGGLLKKIRPAIKAVGFKVARIVLAGEDGAEFESDYDPEDAVETPEAPGVPDAAEAQARFAALLKSLGPEIAKAVAEGRANAQDIKLKASEAALFGRKQQWVDGLALLQQIEQLLGSGGSTGTDTGGGMAGKAGTAGTAGTSPGAESRTGGTAPGIAFTQSRLVWDSTRKKVQSELRRLEASILDICKDEPDFAAIAAGAKTLYARLDFLDERLIDKLDEALNAATPEERRARHDEAREIVSEYVDFVESEELLQDIDDNGFVGVAIKSSLTTSLGAIDKRLKA